jgi:hypothetical protein
VAHSPPDIPGFQVVREIGHGGMGVVYEVVDDFLQHTFALKVIRADRISPDHVERFANEAKALLTLEHPHIARVFFFGISDNGPYYTMRLQQGTLAEQVGEFRDDPRRAVTLMAKVADAVHYLHEHGHIHRDLKPRNILLDEHGDPQVSDFGLVKAIDELFSDPARSTFRGNAWTETSSFSPAGESVTGTGGAVGTLPYMPPEQLLNQREKIGRQTDIWALGVILYELLCGVRPFESPTPSGVSDQIRNQPPRPPTSLSADVAPELERIVLRCLAKEPSARYGSAAELAKDLRGWLDRSARRPRFRAWQAALPALALLCGAGILIYLFVVKSGNERHAKISELDHIKAELTSRGAVSLVADGGPRWHRWYGGEGAEIIAPADNGGLFGFRSTQARLLEVADGLPAAHYVFRAEIRHDGGNGYMGVYSGRSPFEGGGAVHQAMFGIQIQRPIRKREGGPLTAGVAVGFICCPDAQARGMFFSTSIFEQIDRPVPADGWRVIEIEQGPESIVVSLDGAVIARTTPGHLATKAAERRIGQAGFEKLNPAFAPTDGIGLFANDSQVSVRGLNLKLVP